MTQAPEITAFKALAAAGALLVVEESTHQMFLSLGRNTTLLVMQQNSDARDEPDPTAPWLLQFEFRSHPGRLPTNPSELAAKLTAALIRVADVIEKAGAAP